MCLNLPQSTGFRCSNLNSFPYKEEASRRLFRRSCIFFLRDQLHDEEATLQLGVSCAFVNSILFLSNA